jgi:hypothetical protein
MGIMWGRVKLFFTKDSDLFAFVKVGAEDGVNKHY